MSSPAGPRRANLGARRGRRDPLIISLCSYFAIFSNMLT